ncbi:hypothetical protein ABGB07_43435 [Micromonosporaceae bacterium B7E4]
MTAVVLDPSVIDWRSTWDVRGGPGVSVSVLLDRLAHSPDATVWHELENRLVVEGECCCSAGFAALPELARLAQSGTDEHRDRALDLAAVIVRSLHRYDEHDDLVRANPAALAVLHRLAQARLPGCAGPELVGRLQDSLALAGYTFWASISLDFTDEHYHLRCPHCATRLAIVIGDYGHYSAIRDHDDGDIHRVSLHPAAPGGLTGIGRWAHGIAAAGGDTTLADGLTYLFGRATWSMCGSKFDLADWLEAENSPSQPIDPIVPRTDRST